MARDQTTRSSGALEADPAFGEVPARSGTKPGSRSLTQALAFQSHPGARAREARAARSAPRHENPVDAAEDHVREELEHDPGTFTYTVRHRDNLQKIAKNAHVPPVYIRRLNPHVAWSKLAVGDKIRVPSAKAVKSLEVQTMDMGNVPRLDTYEPGSTEWKQLFTRAAELIGKPEWMKGKSLTALEHIFKGARGTPGENVEGYVMRPNYNYGKRARPSNRDQWSDIRAELMRGRIEGQDHIRAGRRSSAIGLGQLTLPNIDEYHPGGRTTIGDPLAEAIGMLRYIEDRYGSPEKAWQKKVKSHVY